MIIKAFQVNKDGKIELNPLELKKNNARGIQRRPRIQKN